MADTLKNRVRFSTTLRPETERRLKEFSDKTMMPITKIVDAAITEFMESYLENQRRRDNPASPKESPFDRGESPLRGNR